MATYNNSNGGGNNNNNFDWGSWIPIIVLFCIPTPVTWIIAGIWLISKLRGVGQNWKQGNFKRHPYDLEREGHPYDKADQDSWEKVTWEEGDGQAKPTADRVVDEGRAYSTKSSGGKVADSGKKKSTKTSKKTKKAKKTDEGSGTGLIIGGAVMAGFFGLGAIGTLAEAFQGYGLWGEDLVGFIACLMFVVGSLAMLASGVGINRRAERYVNYLAYIGANREVPLAHMAATFGVSVGKLCKDLRRMLAKGILPTGYLDLAEGKLYLTEMGYRPQPAREEKPKAEPVKTVEENEDAILAEIRQVNGEIPDAEMSAKIDRIEEITGKILIYQKKHPNREGQLRTFLNYYLPTTLKILRAYAQLDAQGIEGENISAAKARIEGMMDQVVAGFEKQLDKLFQDDALDIATDVEVLENMLKKDGLSDGQGFTMGL